jgi:methionine-rich copper-binding protein CopC
VKRILASGVLAVALLGSAAALAPSATAHSELVSSDPADGASLDAPPTTVSFTFNEDLLPDFVSLVATNPAGVTGDLPVASVEGPTATAEWPANAEGGEWTVSYRVVSQDGHPIEGGITFSFEGPAPTSSGPAPTSAVPTTAAPTTPAPTTAAPTSAAPSPSTSPAANTTGGSSGVLIAALAVGAIVIVGVVVALVARRRT